MPHREISSWAAYLGRTAAAKSLGGEGLLCHRQRAARDQRRRDDQKRKGAPVDHEGQRCGPWKWAPWGIHAAGSECETVKLWLHGPAGLAQLCEKPHLSLVYAGHGLKHKVVVGVATCAHCSYSQGVMRRDGSPFQGGPVVVGGSWNAARRRGAHGSLRPRGGYYALYHFHCHLKQSSLFPLPQRVCVISTQDCLMRSWPGGWGYSSGLVSQLEGAMTMAVTHEKTMGERRVRCRSEPR